jgi:hypothetical protein
MVRVFVLYQAVPEAERYASHADLCRQVPGGSFRHGPVTRTLVGDPVAYYAEWEFPDTDVFREAARTDEFRATGADAAEMGVPHSVHVVEVG